jgi:hypothetical protein
MTASPEARPSAVGGPDPTLTTTPVPTPSIVRRSSAGRSGPGRSTSRASGARRWLLGAGIVALALGLIATLPGMLDDGSPSGSDGRSTIGGLSLPSDEPATDEPRPGDIVTAAPTEDGAGATPATTQIRTVKLVEAVEAGQVRMTARGDGLDSLDIGLYSLTGEPLDVIVSTGTIFAPKSRSTQRMIVTRRAVVRAEPGDLAVNYSLDVACASMERNAPDRGDTFKLSTTPPKSDLMRLVRAPAFAEASFRVQQFAVWTITDNPRRGEYVGLSYTGVGGAPTRSEFAQIKSLFRKAGIDAAKYAAF